MACFWLVKIWLAKEILDKSTWPVKLLDNTVLLLDMGKNAYKYRTWHMPILSYN